MRRAPRLPRAPAHLWLRVAPHRQERGAGGRLPRPLGPLTPSCRRRPPTFPSLRAAPVRTNFPSEVAFCRVPPLCFRCFCWLFPRPFFFFSSSFATTTTLIGAHPQRSAQGAQAGASRPPGARSGGRGSSARLRAGAEELASGGEGLTAGRRARARPNAEFCLGTTCQEKRRLQTRPSNL